MQVFLDHDTTLSKTFGPSNATPLISAATRGHTEVVKQLLAQDFGLVELAKTNGKNALHFAARQGHVEIVKSLLDKDPQLARRTDRKGQTALHMAVKGTNCDVVKALVDADPAIVMLPDKYGNTALHVATRKKRAEVKLIDAHCWYFTYPINACINEGSYLIPTSNIQIMIAAHATIFIPLSLILSVGIQGIIWF